jgi:thiol-disulfide isomerase/thioredoxin
MGYEVKGQINKENVLDADKDIIDDSNKKKLLVFLSKTCPHCVNYDKITHNKLKKELEDKMLIEKIYSDNDTHGLFNKYNIKYVPKGVVISNGKGYEVNGQLKSENIMNADKINNIEQFNNMETDKKKLLVFLSKTCPHCVNYDKITHNKLQKELEDIMPIEKIYDDADPQGLFKKYNVKYIPKCIVISGGMGYEVKGQINKENVLDADKDIIDVSNKKKLLVFLSKTCPHCITYEKETHDKLLKELLKELDNEIMIEKVYSDNDTQGLFNKYNINFVPAGILLSRERHIPIEGIINTENIKEQIKNL